MRERLLMNRDWLFYFGEPGYKLPKYTSSDQQYRGSRAENARGPARRDFDDSAWRRVQLPHDFVAENGVTDKNPFGGEHYDFPRDRGAGWYRRYFRLEEADRARRIILHFEGVQTKCEVYVNSMLLKTNHTAGIGFDVDITDVAKFGFDYNLVAVHADCRDYEAWYYEGGGICRSVWLQKTDRLCVALWGTFVKSKRLEGDIWRLDIETEIENRYYEEKTAYVLAEIYGPDGALAGQAGPREIKVGAFAGDVIRQSLTLESPRLWDTGHCNLYKLVTKVELDGSVVDEYETGFGIREVIFDAEKGMLLNGEKVSIYGFANHMLYLGVGDAMSDSMREFQLKTMRDMGSNGFRMVHSPHAEKTYEYCDRYGVLVMDENRLFQPSDIVMDEVARMVRRDRNHPSVILYSLYNEEDTVTHETGKRVFRTLAQAARRFDDTRPMTGATSYGLFTEGAHEDYDLIGFNHQTKNFDSLHRAKPGKPLFCAEMIFPLGEPGYMRTGVYGLDVKALEKHYVIGGFHFTGWRYGPEKARIFDGLGVPGACAHGFRAYLRQDAPYAKIYPAWNFPGKEGEKVTLNLANNGDTAKVYRNGKLEDEIKTDLYAITPYETHYMPGQLRIDVYKNGELWAQDVSETPGAPCALRLRLENPSALKADDCDVAIVTAELTDCAGNVLELETGYPVTFSANEAGEFVCAVTTREDGLQGYHSPEIRLVDGRCQAFFRSMRRGGQLVVTASSPGLETGRLIIERDFSRPVACVAPAPNNFVLDWAVSKLYPYTIDEYRIMKERMVERWEHIDTLGAPDVLYNAARMYPAGTSFNYAYHAVSVIPDMGDAGGKPYALHFEGIDGEANIYVVGAGKSAHGRHPSDSPWPGHYRPEMIVPCEGFRAGDEVDIWVFMRNAGRVHGIGWPVRWTHATQDEAAALDAKTAREWAASRGE